MGMGQNFEGKTMDYTIKVTDSASGEFFVGLEPLASAATDTTVTLSYAQTAFTQPFVSILTESFANADSYGIINIDEYKMEEASAEAAEKLGTALYGTGVGNQPLGLEGIVDDGTNNSSIGGQSRSTYTTLKSTVTASGGSLSLNKLAVLEDAISASGMTSEAPNIHLTTKTVWSSYEGLLNPTVRTEYSSAGYAQVALRGNGSIQQRASIPGGLGFDALSWRGNGVLRDDACTSGVWYMLNERYLFWAGRTKVPEAYKDCVEKVDFGERKTIEGVGAELLPPTTYGWFVQKRMMLPNQGGMVGRYYVLGQTIATQPRKFGKLTGITGI